ncbi:FAD:protein FMN transferase [Aeoliella sp. ICT_H6.2]|uniref:FAD:protein FMN transferase n=1 Tax=Aeoliella straminimaris TaxID=2954799 RepID=A0A9X2JL27_9BACT|nr:FAD:protein FMN transferase [Aeoliella straminimaris]MCO6047939.1 FAD:protein FMN transferase [Aeoliella straminimaris]
MSNTPTTSVPRGLQAAIVAVCLLLSAAVAPCCHADGSPTEAKLAGATMGTTWHATLDYNADDFTEAQVQQLIQNRLNEINSLMSTYDPGSELSRFNTSKSTEWFEVSAETANVVAAALGVAKSSEGAFDPTVGPLVNLWGFGPDGRRKEPPTDEQIQEAFQRVGYQQVEVQLDPPAIRKSNPEVYLDLSAIAKGYAADAVSEMLKGHAELANTYSMVEIGGEIRTRGAHGDEPWKLGIQRPDSDEGTMTHVVEIDNNAALATSGDYRNFFADHGQRYSHTIDPKTGRPVTHDLATVTVRCPTCMEADALATALSVMGPEQGYAWAEANNVAAILGERANGQPRELITPAWQATEELRGQQPNAEATASDPGQQSESSGLLTYVVISLVAFLLAIGGMAIGVILSNRCIKGTCGGIANLQGSDGKTACELCSNPSPTCSGNPQNQEPVESSS